MRRVFTFVLIFQMALGTTAFSMPEEAEDAAPIVDSKTSQIDREQRVLDLLKKYLSEGLSQEEVSRALEEIFIEARDSQEDPRQLMAVWNSQMTLIMAKVIDLLKKEEARDLFFKEVGIQKKDDGLLDFSRVIFFELSQEQYQKWDRFFGEHELKKEAGEEKAKTIPHAEYAKELKIKFDQFNGALKNYAALIKGDNFNVLSLIDSAWRNVTPTLDGFGTIENRLIHIVNDIEALGAPPEVMEQLKMKKKEALKEGGKYLSAVIQQIEDTDQTFFYAKISSGVFAAALAVFGGAALLAEGTLAVLGTGAFKSGVIAYLMISGIAGLKGMAEFIIRSAYNYDHFSVDHFANDILTRLVGAVPWAAGAGTLVGGIVVMGLGGTVAVTSVAYTLLGLGVFVGSFKVGTGIWNLTMEDNTYEESGILILTEGVIDLAVSSAIFKWMQLRQAEGKFRTRYQPNNEGLPYDGSPPSSPDGGFPGQPTGVSPRAASPSTSTGPQAALMEPETSEFVIPDYSPWVLEPPLEPLPAIHSFIPMPRIGDEFMISIDPNEEPNEPDIWIFRFDPDTGEMIGIRYGPESSVMPFEKTIAGNGFSPDNRETLTEDETDLLANILFPFLGQRIDIRHIQIERHERNGRRGFLIRGKYRSYFICLDDDLHRTRPIYITGEKGEAVEIRVRTENLTEDDLRTIFQELYRLFQHEEFSAEEDSEEPTGMILDQIRFFLETTLGPDWQNHHEEYELVPTKQPKTEIELMADALISITMGQRPDNKEDALQAALYLVNLGSERFKDQISPGGRRIIWDLLAGLDDEEIIPLLGPIFELHTGFCSEIFIFRIEHLAISLASRRVREIFYTYAILACHGVQNLPNDKSILEEIRGHLLNGFISASAEERQLRMILIEALVGYLSRYPDNQMRDHVHLAEQTICEVFLNDSEDREVRKYSERRLAGFWKVLSEHGANPEQSTSAIRFLIEKLKAPYCQTEASLKFARMVAKNIFKQMPPDLVLPHLLPLFSEPDLHKALYEIVKDMGEPARDVLRSIQENEKENPELRELARMALRYVFQDHEGTDPK